VVGPSPKSTILSIKRSILNMQTSVSFDNNIGVTEEVVTEPVVVEKDCAATTSNKPKRILKKELSVRRSDGTWSEKQPSWLSIKEIERKRRKILKRVSTKNVDRQSIAKNS